MSLVLFSTYEIQNDIQIRPGFVALSRTNVNFMSLYSFLKQKSSFKIKAYKATKKYKN